MNARLPWWLKLGAKLVLSRLPLGYAAWQRLGLFRHGCMDSSRYAIQVFEAHTERAGVKSALRGKMILELGPGDSLSSAIIAAAHDAHTILVDSGSFVRADIEPYVELERELARNGLRPPDLYSCLTIEDILDRCNARYMTRGLESLRQIETQAVDLIFSQAVLEHVRLSEFNETMHELRRVLRPDGVCSHRVDLRDHLGGGLNNLRFRESLWESGFFSRSGFYTNRIRYSRMLEFFRSAGFAVEVVGLERWNPLPIRRDRLAREFRALSDEELSISAFDVILRPR